MMNYQSAPQLKKLAKLIARIGAKKGQPMAMGEALDVLAKSYGYKAWSALSHKLSAQGIDASLSANEKHHIADAGDADIRAEETGIGGYGHECALQAHTGFYLKTPAYPADCTYVRVCDPLGREIVYWDEEEWRQDPAGVMGAIVGALNRGSDVRAPQSEALPGVSRLQELEAFVSTITECKTQGDFEEGMDHFDAVSALSEIVGQARELARKSSTVTQEAV
jgi:hypothetical protein